VRTTSAWDRVQADRRQADGACTFEASLKLAKSETEAIQKAIDLVLFQEEAARAWIDAGGTGGVEDLYAR
jgi:hypothetical protein